MHSEKPSLDKIDEQIGCTIREEKGMLRTGWNGKKLWISKPDETHGRVVRSEPHQSKVGLHPVFELDAQLVSEWQTTLYVSHSRLPQFICHRSKVAILPTGKIGHQLDWEPTKDKAARKTVEGKSSGEENPRAG